MTKQELADLPRWTGSNESPQGWYRVPLEQEQRSQTCSTHYALEGPNSPRRLAVACYYGPDCFLYLCGYCCGAKDVTGPLDLVELASPFAGPVTPAVTAGAVLLDRPRELSHEERLSEDSDDEPELADSESVEEQEHDLAVGEDEDSDHDEDELTDEELDDTGEEGDDDGDE